MRRSSASAAAVLLTLLWVCLTAAPASAHATLVSSDPTEGAVLAESPSEVTFTFDEPVRLVPDALQAFDADGDPVAIEPSGSGAIVTGDLPDGLDEGTYVVAWRVVSADGHPIAGSLTFHVGAASPSVAPPKLGTTDTGSLSTPQSIVQGVDYVALLLAGGLAVFVGWTARGTRLPDAVRRRLVAVLRGSAVVAVLAAAVAVPLSGAYQLGGGPGGLVDPAALDPQLVRDELVVLVLQALGLVAAAWSAGRERPSLTADLGTALAVWSPALVGHTRAYEPSTLLVVTDALHLTTGAVWLGGVVGLALALPVLAGRPREAARLLTRFSTTAAALLALLAASGVLMAWRILGSWSGLVEAAYGRLLLVKAVLVLLVVAVAAFNRYRLLPRVTDGAGHDGQRRGALAVRRVVVAEAVVLVAVLGVTGFLTQKPPAGEPPGTPQTAGTGVVTGAAGELRVLAVLDPGPGTQRRLIVQVQDEAGEPLDLYDPPSVELRSATVDLGEIPVVPAGVGTYTAEVLFPTRGEWQLQVGVRSDEFTSPVTTLLLSVS
ncbi:MULTISPECIES: copper resistance protein CopC [Nocardioides]|uniref:Copper resistance protein CopC n=1 Tax=Nocardioides vastitatis TaxID=2568655 RepID=A0ABW0ZJ20_9ACTN|nr:copper resistance protein CopC [Nocardioides sp.]THI99950.1 copper resistance protein CopC [Nocardioides sp.]